MVILHEVLCNLSESAESVQENKYEPMQLDKIMPHVIKEMNIMNSPEQMHRLPAQS
jgi:hypothetical protein